MPDPIVAPAAIPNPADVKATPAVPSLLNDAGKEAAAGTPSVLDEAAKAAQEAQAAEEKRLLETPEDQLSDEDKSKKTELVKAKDEAKTKAEADAKAKQAPEKYEFKAPEGMVLDQALIDEVTPVFKKLGLSQAQAQELADVYAKRLQAQADAQAQEFKKFQEDSKAETIKALGANYKEELVYVAKARDRFLSEETRSMLDASGLSNNKAFILDLIKLGKLISEDKIVSGKTATPQGNKPPDQVLYPNQGKS